MLARRDFACKDKAFGPATNAGKKSAHDHRIVKIRRIGGHHGAIFDCDSGIPVIPDRAKVTGLGLGECFR